MKDEAAKKNAFLADHSSNINNGRIDSRAAIEGKRETERRRKADKGRKKNGSAKKNAFLADRLSSPNNRRIGFQAVFDDGNDAFITLEKRRTKKTGKEKAAWNTGNGCGS